VNTGRGSQSALAVAKKRRKRSLKQKLQWLGDHFKNEWQIYVMLAPAIIWFLVFLYKPMYGLQSALNLLFGFPAPILLALMFNEILHATYKRVTQTIVYLPHFISSVVIAGIVTTAFSPTAGVVNTIMGWFGLDSIYFLTRPEWFRPIFVGTGIWQEAGFGSIHLYTKAQ